MPVANARFFWDIVGDSASNKNEKGFSVATGILAKHRRGDGGNPSKWPNKNRRSLRLVIDMKIIHPDRNSCHTLPVGHEGEKNKKVATRRSTSIYQLIQPWLLKVQLKWYIQKIVDVLRISCCFFLLPRGCGVIITTRVFRASLATKKWGSFGLGHWCASFCLVFWKPDSKSW